MRNTLNNHQSNAFVVEMVCNVISALSMHGLYFIECW